MTVGGRIGRRLFRDPEALEALLEQVRRGFAERSGEQRSLRVWVPGCATGEDVYAIGIGLLESVDRCAARLPIKIFGTDTSELAIGTARRGRYEEADLVGVGPERRRLFFERVEGGYKVGKRLRELCVFAKHDLVRDMPISRLDLISCRNVLGGLDARSRRRTIPMLHFCLARQGLLFLGQNDAAGDLQELFSAADEEHRIFRKVGESRPFGPARGAPQGSSTAPETSDRVRGCPNLRPVDGEREQVLADEKKARHAAESANRAKDVFLAMLAHELRSTVATLVMAAPILSAAPERQERRKIAWARASLSRTTQLQARLVDDLLDISRAVAGKLVLDRGPVDLEALVRSAVDVARPVSAAKALALKVAIEGPLATISADGVRLLQVLNNLLGNAIKFTPRGGCISITLAQRSNEIRLAISDTGVGISPAMLPAVFNKFEQADASLTRGQGGLGLGLAIAQHVLEAHGGRISAESAGEGKGSTFRVVLPIGAQTRRRTAAPRPRRGGRIEGVRVLLIEDNDDIREGCALMLMELGAEVCAVSSAAAGLGALETFRPQAILCDIVMPGEDGFTFIRRLRRLPVEKGGRLPAAALTAMAGARERQLTREVGFQTHVTKPFDQAQLAAAVGALIDDGKPPPSRATAAGRSA